MKTAGVDASILKFDGPARVFESQEAAVEGILGGKIVAGDVVRDPLRRAARRPRHAGDALSDQLSEIEGPRQSLRAHHRRPLFRRHLGPVDRPRLAGGGGGRRRSRSSRTATGSRSTFPPAPSRWSSPTKNWRAAAPRWRRRATTPGSRPSRAAPRVHGAARLCRADHQRRARRGARIPASLGRAGIVRCFRARFLNLNPASR